MERHRAQVGDRLDLTVFGHRPVGEVENVPAVRRPEGGRDVLGGHHQVAVLLEALQIGDAEVVDRQADLPRQPDVEVGEGEAVRLVRLPDLLGRGGEAALIAQLGAVAMQQRLQELIESRGRLAAGLDLLPHPVAHLLVGAERHHDFVGIESPFSNLDPKAVPHRHGQPAGGRGAGREKRDGDDKRRTPSGLRGCEDSVESADHSPSVRPENGTRER